MRLLQLDLDGKVIKEWNSVNKASKVLGISQGNISMVYLGKRRIAGGFRWMLYEDYIKTEDKSLRKIKTTAKEVEQYSLKGEYINSFNSIAEAADKLNIMGEKITMVCKGQRQQCGGYFWRYKKNPLNDELFEKIKKGEIKFNLFTEENSLEKIAPEIAKRWDYSRNGEITPKMVAAHSGVKYYFTCEKGHSFKCKVTHMVDDKINCPTCSKEKKTSIPEFSVYFYIKKYFPDSIHSYKTDWLGQKEIDIFIPSLNIGIEYDGQRWHTDKEKDILKNDLCKNNNIKLIRIREPKCVKLNDSSIDFYLEGLNTKDLDKQIFNLLKFLKINDIFESDICIDNDNIEIMNLSTFTLKENSFELKCPELLYLWNYEKNGIITPDLITFKSEKKMWWKCKENHEWQNTVSHISSGERCPYCVGKKVLMGYNDIETISPEIIPFWNDDTLSYNDLTPKSGKIVRFKCPNCKEIWKERIYDFNKRKTYKCPFCKDKNES